MRWEAKVKMVKGRRVGRRQGRTKGKKGKQGAQVAERIEDGEAK